MFGRIWRNVATENKQKCDDKKSLRPKKFFVSDMNTPVHFWVRQQRTEIYAGRAIFKKNAKSSFITKDKQK